MSVLTYLYCMHVVKMSVLVCEVEVWNLGLMVEGTCRQRKVTFFSQFLLRSESVYTPMVSFQFVILLGSFQRQILIFTLTDVMVRFSTLSASTYLNSRT
jgi:hypothetical protein